MNTDDHRQPASGDNLPAWRRELMDRINSKPTKVFVVGVIVINLVILGIQATPLGKSEAGRLLDIANHICIGIFMVELLLKGLAYRLEIFKRGWDVFDILVVAVAALSSSTSALRGLRGLRGLNAFQASRLVSTIPSLRRVVMAFLRALPGVGAIGLLMIFFLYISAVMATGFFSGTHSELFGNLGKSIYSLFQVMTLEGWSMEIVAPVMKTHPWAWAFFIPFIIFGAFTILNLFIGIIVSAMQELDILDRQSNSEKKDALELVERLERDLAELRRRLDESPGK